MAKDLAETNPPLIILVYAVPALIAKLTGLPIYYFPFYMMLALNILSSLAIYGLLRYGKMLDKPLCAVATGVALIGLTLITGYETGQREHLIITGLLPFFLAQYAIDKKAEIPSWLIYGTLKIETESPKRYGWRQNDKEKSSALYRFTRTYEY